MANRRRWWLPDRPAVDVTLSAELRIKALQGRTGWPLYRVPLGSQRDVAMIDRARIFRVRLYDISQRASDFGVLPREIRDAIARGDSELEALLSIGSDAFLRVLVSGTHSYTQARSTELVDYRLGDIELR